MPTFNAPTKLIWDVEICEALAGILNENGWRRIGVIVDVKLARDPRVTEILSRLRGHAERVQVFEQSFSEPDTDSTDSVSSHFKQDVPEALIGIGGGSVLDMTKAVAILVTNPGHAADYQGFNLVSQPGLPTVAVPTTAGSGSEVTWTAVLTNRETQRKAGINSPHLFPKYALLDARLTLSMPKALTVSTAMDAIAHAIESFSAQSSTVVTRMISKEAFQLLYLNLPKVAADGSDLEARKQMQLGSSLAGWAIVNAGTGACHSVAYALGTHFHIPHGMANAMLLTKVMRMNHQKRPGLYAYLWDLVHPEEVGMPAVTRSDHLISELEQVLERAAFKTSLLDFGVSLEHIDWLAGEGLKLKSALSNNPVEFDYEDSKAVLKEIL
jgi:alcohol dehydrogenase